jgi:hypothetical protein
MITSGFDKEFVIAHTVTDDAPAGQRGIRGELEQRVSLQKCWRALGSPVLSRTRCRVGLRGVNLFPATHLVQKKL